MTRNDMLMALRGEPKAEEAIFWFAYAWHSGKGSDLYRVLRESPFIPSETRKFNEDPEVVRLFGELERHFQPTIEAAYQPVHLSDVQEGDVLIAGAHHICLPNRWPCRVVKWEGSLCVVCRQGHHRLRADDRGFVVGFRR